MNYIKSLVKQLIPFGLKLTMVAVAGVALLLIGSWVVFTSASNNLTPHSAKEMSVTGTAKKKVSPDSARIVLGKNIRGTNITEIQTKAATAVNSLMAKLKAAGIKENQITTSNYSVTPVYDNNNDVKTYAINISVVVDMEKQNPQQDLLSKVIAAGTESGVDEVHSLSFYLADYDQEVKALEEAAIADAKQTAQKRVAAAGASLGKVINIGGSGYYYPQYYYGDRATASGGETAPVPTKDIDFSVGSFDLQASVSVTYEIL